MKRIWFVLAVAALLLSGCRASGSDSTAATEQSVDPAVMEGAQLFNKATLGGLAGCSTCHSLSAGTVIVGPSLAQIGQEAAQRVPGLTAEEYLHQSIVEPNAYLVDDFTRGLMPREYGDHLTQDEIDSLVAYLLTLQ